MIGTATSFYLLLSAVPLYTRSAGAGTGLAGLTTTALTPSGVAAYPVTPRLMARYGSRVVLAAACSRSGCPRWPWLPNARGYYYPRRRHAGRPAVSRPPGKLGHR